MSESLTANDVSLLDKQVGLRDSHIHGHSSHRSNNIGGLQYEIEKYQKEIELLKLKLQFKQQVIEYRNLNNGRPSMRMSSHQNPGSLMGNGMGCQSLCGMGPQKNGSLECAIF